MPVGAVVAAARWQHPSQEWLSIVAEGPRPQGVDHNCHGAASAEVFEDVFPCFDGDSRVEDDGNCVDVCKELNKLLVNSIWYTGLAHTKIKNEKKVYEIGQWFPKYRYLPEKR